MCKITNSISDGESQSRCRRGRSHRSNLVCKRRHGRIEQTWKKIIIETENIFLKITKTHLTIDQEQCFKNKFCLKKQSISLKSLRYLMHKQQFNVTYQTANDFRINFVFLWLILFYSIALPTVQLFFAFNKRICLDCLNVTDVSFLFQVSL